MAIKELKTSLRPKPDYTQAIEALKILSQQFTLE